MCGIFGILISQKRQVDFSALTLDLSSLFELSESRGKESAGLAFKGPHEILVYKAPLKASDMLSSEGYRKFWARCQEDVHNRGASPILAIGHARLVTNGLQGVNSNNQPVIYEDVVGVHNGIICNDREIWAANPHLKRATDVDTEALLALVKDRLSKGNSPQSAIRFAFSQIVGQASVAIILGGANKVLLATNHGSLYAARDAQLGLLAFGSEQAIVQKYLAKSRLFRSDPSPAVVHLAPGVAWLVDIETGEVDSFHLGDSSKLEAAQVAPSPIKVIDWRAEETRRAQRLDRCTKCVLPITVPNLRLDAQGVCYYCRTHKQGQPSGLEALRKAVAPFRRTDGKPDCIVAFSGGRDSSYGLHFAKVVLGLNPIAYTYDWGMVTDLARRNISRMCAKLGVEHILVSADIRHKRENIRKNLLAWMAKPDLGMIPLLMAGDKEYYMHANRLKEELGLDLLFFSSNPFEKTNFKTGFCGVREKLQDGEQASIRISNMSLFNKFRLASYYLKCFVKNPAYLNRSLWDTFKAFLATYFTKHDYLFLFDFISWNESEIDQVLKAEYDWETAKDTDSTWRIGDGTAALYNHIYFTAAGFSEVDTFRANQVREGVLDRQSALALVKSENVPRYDSIIEYANLISVNPNDLLSTVDSMKRLY
jgi:glutamine---fructose-6-phosphate transaminase (isomerizing)